MILRWIKELKCFTERKLCKEAWRWNESSKHGMRAGMLYRLPVINSKHRRQAGFRFSIGPETFRTRRQILKSKLVELLQAPSSQTNHKSILLPYLIFSLYHFQNYWNFDLECKHGLHKTAFRARKVIGTFEKWAPGPKPIVQLQSF